MILLCGFYAQFTNYQAVILVRGSNADEVRSRVIVKCLGAWIDKGIKCRVYCRDCDSVSTAQASQNVCLHGSRQRKREPVISNR